jgi:cytochrome P450
MFKDQMYSTLSILNLTSLLFRKYNIGSTNKTIVKNVENALNSLEEFLKVSKDQDSVYSRVIKTAEATQKELLWDLVFYLFAGHDTSSSCFIRCIFELSRSEETREKLLKEIKVLESLGEDIESSITSENIEEMTFLNIMIKETLRINNPVIRSIGYSAVSDFTTSDGLFIPKDQVIEFNLTSVHHNPDQWQCPDEFIPE